MTKNNTYLVTGAMGCIGAWTLYHLQRSGAQVVSLDVSDHRDRLNLLLPPAEQGGITFVQADVREFDQVRRVIGDHNVSHIIHLGALQVPMCKADPVLGAQVNVVGTVNLFEAARQQGITHLAYASSIAVYGAPDEYGLGLQGDDAAHNPHTLYGVYKVANEGTARVYWQDHGISSVGLRPYTVYGVGRDQGLTSDPTKAMLAAVKGEPFEIKFGGKMQLQWASDVARQFILAADMPIEGAPVFNLGTPPVSIDEVIAQIKVVRPAAAITRSDKILPFPEGFDDSSLRAAMPHTYETTLAAGVRTTMDAFTALVAAGML